HDAGRLHRYGNAAAAGRSGRNAPDAVAGGVGDVKIAAGRHRDATEFVAESRQRRDGAVRIEPRKGCGRIDLARWSEREPARNVDGHGEDLPARGQLENLEGVRNKNIPGCIQRQTGWIETSENLGVAGV